MPDETPIGTFRRGLESDAATLAGFAARTFRATFGHSTSVENMDAHCAMWYGIEQQGRDLRDPHEMTWLLEHDGALIAFTQVRRHPPPIPLPHPNIIEIKRFYVDAPWHGRGIAQRLMHVARDAARDLGGEWLWLSVWSENDRAIAFYKKAGFTDVGEIDFWLGDERQFDRLMVAPLERGP